MFFTSSSTSTFVKCCFHYYCSNKMLLWAMVGVKSEQYTKHIYTIGQHEFHGKIVRFWAHKVTEKIKLKN